MTTRVVCADCGSLIEVAHEPSDCAEVIDALRAEHEDALVDEYRLQHFERDARMEAEEREDG